MFLNSNVQNVLGVFGNVLSVTLLVGLMNFASVEAGVNGGRIIYNPEKHVAEGEPIYIEAGFTTGIERASVYYRFPTDPAFTEVPMIMKMNGKYGAFLKKQGLKKGTILEYYIVAESSDGQSLTYPENNPEMLPLQLVVSERAVVQEAGIETIVLSPDPGSTVNKKDFLIAISLFSDDTINVVNLKLTLDGGDDVTKKSDITNELVTYAGKNLEPGPHAARLWYTLPNGDKVILTEFTFDIALEGGEDILAGKGFTAATAGQLQPGSDANFDDAGKFRANFRSEHKAQNNLGQKTTYERVGADISYEKKFFQVAATFDWDSEDDPTKNQPLSRYLITANVDNIAIVNYGDSYPTFSPVTLYGTRVRGLSAGLYLGIFNFEFVKGEVNRKVLSKRDKATIQELEDRYNNNTTDDARAAAIIAYLNPDANDPADDKAFGGTFKREMTAGRFSVGPQAFQFGLSYVHTGDKESSLYSQTLISTGFNGVAPQENVVVGADFKTSLFSKRFNFDASVATGLTNTNITGGTVDAQTLADANLIKQTEVKDVQDYIDLADNFMTINTNLTPIPTGADFITDKNNFAYTFGGSLSAFDNNLSARYRSNGGYFQSFGSSIQRDIETFEISDRHRFWQNRIFVTVNYATSKNNLSKSNDNTLETQTIGTNFSLFLPKLPSLSFGYTTMNRDNNFNYTTPKVGALPEESVTNIISLGSSYGFSAMDLRHNATVNYSTSKKDDKTESYIVETTVNAVQDTFSYIPFQASDNNSVSLGITTEWKFPLRTTVNFSSSSGNTRSIAASGNVQKDKSSATGFGVSGDYQLLNTDKLILNVYGGLSYTGVSIPNSSDLSLTSINLGQRFNFYKNNTLTLNFNLTSGIKIPQFDSGGNVTGTKSEINSLFSARYDFVF
ncbi:hypothetical protein F9K33_00835 [bacterium]|nr:MAG: hypothetical protein F9K33_00835 [bacterium]